MTTRQLSRLGLVALGLAVSGFVSVPAQLGMTEIPLADAVTASAGRGGGPEAVAFDGAYIWVAGQFTNSVMRLDPLTGLRLGTFPVGARPVALLAVGRTLWVANLHSNTLTKLRTSDGAELGTFRVGDAPGGSRSTASTSGWRIGTTTRSAGYR